METEINRRTDRGSGTRAGHDTPACADANLAPAADPADSAQGHDRSARIERVAADVVLRRRRGEAVPDEQVIAENRDLMPELADELGALRMLQRVYLAAQRAGPLRDPLRPVRLSEMDAPIEAPDTEEEQPPCTKEFPAAEERHPERAGEAFIPGYHVLREIACGGQATVFEGMQQITGRRVAIKVLPGGPLASSKERGRFDREAKILASLEHPHIVGILDRGRTKDGSLYLVMPYVDGWALEDFAADSRLADGTFPRQLIRTFVKVAEALHAAHVQHVVHRDIKPSNIRVDLRGDPHLLDFGLASLGSSAGGTRFSARVVTVVGQVMGSLPWMSPEHVSGGGEHIDARSDVYSLGVCLYQCLAGRLPYRTGESFSDTIDAILKSPPPPLAPQIAQFERASELEAIVLKTLAKRREDRYQTAQALADDLGALLEGRPVQLAYARGGVDRPSLGRMGRQRMRWVSVVAPLIVGVALAMVWIWKATRARPSPVTVFPQPSLTNSVGLHLVRISSGEFLMGTAAGNDSLQAVDDPPRLTRIEDGYWIGSTEVTRRQFKEVMGWLPHGQDGDEALPIADVTWLDAKDFCRRLSHKERPHGREYRLPTEVQWEYACRAGKVGNWSGSADPQRMAWFAGNSQKQAHRGGQKEPNHWGLYDMHGNVAEWCEDVFARLQASTTVSDVSEAAAVPYRAVRGGAFDQDAWLCRVPSRHRLQQDQRRPNLGFRVVVVERAAQGN